MGLKNSGLLRRQLAPKDFLDQVAGKAKKGIRLFAGLNGNKTARQMDEQATAYARKRLK